MVMSRMFEVKEEQPAWWEGSGSRALGYEVHLMAWAGSQAPLMESWGVWS